MIKKKKKLL